MPKLMFVDDDGTLLVQGRFVQVDEENTALALDVHVGADVERCASAILLIAAHLLNQENSPFADETLSLSMRVIISALVNASDDEESKTSPEGDAVQKDFREGDLDDSTSGYTFSDN